VLASSSDRALHSGFLDPNKVETFLKKLALQNS